MKPVKQTDEYSCIPLAILNAMRILGVPASKKKYLKPLIRFCRTISFRDKQILKLKHTSGATDSDLRRGLPVLSRHGLSWVWGGKISLPKIKSALARGEIVIATGQVPEGDGWHGHAFVIYGKSDKRYKVANMLRDAEETVTGTFLSRCCRGNGIMVMVKRANTS
jgi:hypothetical protein